MSSRTGDILLQARLIDELQLRSALAYQQQWGGRIAGIVVEKRFAREDAVVDALSKALRLPRVALDRVEKDLAALAKIDEAFARDKGVFPCTLKDGGKTLWLAMSDPSDLPTIDEIQGKTRVRVKIVVSGETEIMAAIDRHYLGKSAAAKHTFGAIELCETGEDDGKVVDISGRTLVRNLNEIKAEAEAGVPGPIASSAAGDLLDDLMGGSVAPTNEGWSAEDLQRLHTLKDQQEKGAHILRTVLQLCLEKRYFSPDDYRSKLQRG